MTQCFENPRYPRRSTVSLIALALTCIAAGAAHAQPTLSKTFTPGTIGPGSVTTATFTIVNGGPGPVTDLAFTDNLPAAVTIADPAAASTTCAFDMGGGLSAPDSGGTITFSGGLLGASQSCTIDVDVTSSTPGAHTNPAITLTSSAGSSMSAPVDLTVATDRPGFSKSFSPGSIPLGARSTLTFTIDNTLNPSAASFLSFTDDLPVGLVIADPANASNDCATGSFNGGVLTAVPGTSTISLGFGGGLDAGAVAAMSSCMIAVDVTATGGGMLDNVTGELTSDFGLSSGKASATLEVTVEDLHLIKEFTGDPVPAGATVVLEFTIRNRDRDFAATDVGFTDDLDATLSGLMATGLPLNDPCGTGSQLSGTSLLTLTGGNLPAEGSCSFSVTLQVPAAAATGVYPNSTSAISGDVNGATLTGNVASDELFVAPTPLLTKTFLDPVTLMPDPVVGAGGSVVLRFSITNTSATSAATDIAFIDELTTFLPAPISATLPADGFCGGGSSISLISVGIGGEGLSMTGGSLAAAAPPCAFDVILDVPAGFPAGIYVNTTEAITATIDGMTVAGPPASDDFTVVAPPDLLKEFLGDPVEPGDAVTLQFTLTHDPLAPGDATAITFTDDLDSTLTGLVAVGLPMNGVCGAGSTISGTSDLTFSGGSLMPGESCTFSITLQVPADAPPGPHTNNTSSVTAIVLGATATGNAASDDLRIAGLTLTKEFTDDPVLPGGTVDLAFTLENDSPVATASSIFFRDDLDNVLGSSPSITGDGITVNDVCGPGNGTLSWSTGNSLLTFQSATLAPGETCSFTVTLDVPANAAPGSYGNATDSFSATVNGSIVVFGNATDDLVVANDLLSLTKAFVGDPVPPGSTVTLRFTLSNLDGAQAAAAVAFSDDLDAALAGLVATGLPIAACGGTVSGTDTITFSGGSLAAGESCSFDVTLAVPAVVPLGTTADNVTSQVTGTIGGLAVTGDPASDTLRIDFLTFSKAFDGPTVAGGTPQLAFTITNLSTADAITGLSFSDDLGTVLPGLVATNLPMNGVCGSGSVLSGSSFLTLTGGNLMAGGDCTFVVDLAVPAMAAPGSFLNTTSDLFQAGARAGDPAVDTLVVEPPPLFGKSFAPGTLVAGAVSTLTFTIDNSASSLPANALDFTDNLPAGVFVAAPANASTTCTGGTLTAVPGTGTVTYTGGSVAPVATCTVSVDVTGTLPGAQVNTTGDLTSSSGNSGPASDTLTVTPAPVPLFSKVFVPDTVAAGGVVNLAFTIDNSGALLPATALDFTDNLPAGVAVANPANASTTCIGGTLTAVPGSGVIAYTGGTVAAGATCTVSVDVSASVAGAQVNTTGDLTSSLGNSGAATDTLTVTPAPVPLFAKAFAPDAIGSGGVSTLTFTIDNTAALLPADALDFTDNLPAGVAVASPANASTTCSGGTLTAAPGSGVIAYTGGSVAAGATCTVSVDVTSATVGTHVNTTGDLTSSLGNSGTATDSLTVDPQPGFTKLFTPNPIAAAGVSTLTFTIDNSASTADATGLDFTDDLPAGVVVASPANASTTCSGGTLTAIPGAGSVSYSGGTVAAGAVCTVAVDVTAAVPGDYVNVSGELTSSLGSSGTATDTLNVLNGELGITKTVLSNPTLPGGFVDLEFTISNASPLFIATDVAFTDDLDAALPGLVATGGGADVCGAGSVLSGASVLSLTGGTLGPDSSCTFSVTLQVPAGAAPGTYTNVTSTVTADVAGVPVTAPPASDDFDVLFVEFNKEFSGTATAGGMATLTFTLVNPDPANGVDGLTFTDDLDAVLPGLEAVGLPMAGVCGAGSEISGTSILTFTGGQLGPGASCAFSVELQIPSTAGGGFFNNITSPIQGIVNGLPVDGGSAGVAIATLSVAGSPIAIPTLSGWGLVLLSASLALLALRRMRG